MVGVRLKPIITTLTVQCGNNPFCLAVRGMHDFLAGYFLSKLKPEDKLYFCKVGQRVVTAGFTRVRLLLQGRPKSRDSRFYMVEFTSAR